jgi:hypothetical protein
MRNSIISALILLAACGTERAAFRPTDNVTRAGPGGRLAASYEIRGGPQEDSHVRVNVWSRGAFIENGQTMARVSVEVLNTGDDNVRIDKDTLRLDGFANDGAPLPAPVLVNTNEPLANAVVVPGETQTLRLEYAMTGAKPDDIGSMRLRWGVVHDDGRQYVQFTDFRRVEDRYVTNGIVYYDPVWGFYDPFFYGHDYRVPVGRVVIRDHATRSVRR